MFALAWANLTHRRLRTALSALAVGLGIALMLISKGLASGSISEVSQRMQSVDADLVILPTGESAVFSNAAPFPAKYQQHLAEMADEKGPLATAIIPVFFERVVMGGQQQRLFGIDPAQMPLFLGTRKARVGKVFDRAVEFARRADAGQLPPLPTTPNEAAENARLADGLEMVIDERLCRVGGYQVGDTIKTMGRDFRIVGVVETGVAGRVFAPIQTLREIAIDGKQNSSMFFVRLRSGLEQVAAADYFQRELGNSVRVELKGDYGRLLSESLAQVNLYLNASSGLALVVCFLFILLTMYTMVLERTREIGILKALGVTRLGLVRLSIYEALLISLLGTALGMLFAWGGRAGLAVLMPLLTVELAPQRLLIALAIGLCGGVASALYPGFRAARLQPAVALSYE